MTRDEIISLSRAEGGMLLVIPSVVKLDPELPLSAQMLYGVITWKCNQAAYTWETNRALGEALGVSAKRVSALLSLLEKRGHIEMEIEYKEDTGEVLRRYIFPVMKSSRGAVMAAVRGVPADPSEAAPPSKQAGPLPQNEDTPPLKEAGPLPENEEVICNNKIKQKENIEKPPKAPQGGRRSREVKTQPDWKPERFARFWAYYPRGEAKQAAIRAWDKLRPSDELIDTMAQALKRQAASEDWQQGVGIPYASTWLNQQRWTDERRAPPAGQAPDAGLLEEAGVHYL